MNYRTMPARCLTIVGLLAGIATFPHPASAQNADSPTFGNRSEQSDGSVALTIGRRLQTEWDTRFGVDARIVPDTGKATPVDTPPLPAPSAGSSGTVWGTVTGPGVALWDKTTVNGRLDPGQEQGNVSATLSRTITLDDNVSVTLQDKYSVTQSLQNSQTALNAIPPGASVFETDRSVRFSLTPTGTTLSAGVATLSGDPQWHNKFSAEQSLGGPLSVTTSVTDPAGPNSNKSISARFKHTW